MNHPQSVRKATRAEDLEAAVEVMLAAYEQTMRSLPPGWQRDVVQGSFARSALIARLVLDE